MTDATWIDQAVNEYPILIDSGETQRMLLTCDHSSHDERNIKTTQHMSTWNMFISQISTIKSVQDKTSTTQTHT